jgi:hypothetical protein
MSVFYDLCLQPVSQAVLFHLQVIPGLKVQPEPFTRTEKPGKTQSGVCSDVPLTENNFVDASRRDADALGKPVLTDPHRAQELLKEDLAGMYGRKLLRHVVLS